VPFTPSHAVVALPFVRTPLIPAAIAVGAMAPDLPLFLRGTPVAYAWTHSAEWVAVTALIALALLFVWRCVLRPAARELSPGWLAARLPTEWDASASAAARATVAPPRRPRTMHAVLLALSLVLGVLSHIVWDLFTHEGRWGVEAIPALTAMWGPQAGYKWLQHGSGVIGLAIMAACVTVWLRGRDAAASVSRVLPSWIRLTWWLSLPVVLLAAWLWGLAVYGPLDGAFTVAHLAYLVLPPACAIWGLLTIALAVSVQVVRAARHASQAGSSRPHGRGAANEVRPPS
jgi:hypothetical protein